MGKIENHIALQNDKMFSYILSIYYKNTISSILIGSFNTLFFLHHHHHHPSAAAESPLTTSRHTSRSHMAARRSSTSNPVSLDITLGKVNLLDLTGRWLGLHRRRRDTASPSARQQCPANSNLLLASLAEIGGSSL